MLEERGWKHRARGETGGAASALRSLDDAEHVTLRFGPQLLHLEMRGVKLPPPHTHF